jgi:hypothetical protein
MKNCLLCGIAIEGESLRCHRCTALQFLGLGINATEKDIWSARHLLTEKLSPDRLSSDQKLKEEAEAKAKIVSSAFLFLTSTSWEREQLQESELLFLDAASDAPTQTEPTSEQSPATPLTNLHWRFRFLFRTGAKVLSTIFIFAFVILLGRYTWIALDVQDSSGSSINDSGKDSGLKGLEEPKRRFVQAVKRDLHRLDPQRFAPADNLQAEESSPPAGQQAAKATPVKMNSRRIDQTPAAPQKLLPYITVGSTREEVLAQQGPPTASSEDKLVYGKSELYFKDGSVVGWRIDPAASPIRVKLWPASAVDPGLASYTVGSSKDVVLVVQGTPTAFTPDKFEYGKSEVYFRNNKVVSWKEDPASAPLWAR